MQGNLLVSRRVLLGGLASVPLLVKPLFAQASDLPLVIVNKDPTCGCCGGWAEHLEAAGFPVQIIETTELEAVRRRLGVPVELAACHTAEVEGYVIEGHVPAAALRRLLAERPAATGLAVPGMPVGSPGMDYPGATPEEFRVILFGSAGQEVFARFLGAREL